METKEVALATRGSVKIADAKGKRKAVFGNWDGEALVTDAGRLATRKAYGTLQNLKGSQLATGYAKAQAFFNTLGEASLAKTASDVASGKMDMKRIYRDPKTGVVTLQAKPADKAVKVLDALKGLPQDVQDKVLAALKIA
jgi:hypothetical protein